MDTNRQLNLKHYSLGTISNITKPQRIFIRWGSEYEPVQFIKFATSPAPIFY
jgi:hypothetical protein